MNRIMVTVSQPIITKYSIRAFVPAEFGTPIHVSRTSVGLYSERTMRQTPAERRT